MKYRLQFTVLESYLPSFLIFFRLASKVPDEKDNILL